MHQPRIHLSSLNRFGNATKRRRHSPTAERIAAEPVVANPHRKLTRYTRPGKVKGALLMWLLGVPIPLILLFFLLKGCVT